MEGRSETRDRRSNRNVDSLQLTEEERKVLRECRMNSLIRGVPAGLLSAFITRFAVKSGKFVHLANWSRFYYTASFTGGLLFGVASYRKTCLEKIMKLENSVLADQVREYYKRAGIEYTGPQSRKGDTGFDDFPVSDYNYSNDSALTPNSISPSSRSNDKENKWPTSNENDWQGYKPEEPKHRSFEELRKLNRQRWHQDQYPVRSSQRLDLGKEENQVKQIDQDSDNYLPAQSHERQTQGSTGIIRRNKYGDPIE